MGSKWTEYAGKWSKVKARVGYDKEIYKVTRADCAPQELSMI